MSDKKQTAVEYLVEQLESIRFSINDLADYYNEVQIALEMEKEQIKNNYLKGCAKVFDVISNSRNGNPIEFVDADKFYNETYGGQDE